MWRQQHFQSFCACACGAVHVLDRNIVVAAAFSIILRLCVVLLSFGAGHRKSYWNGCINAAIVICHEIFSNLGMVISLSKFLLKSASKSSFLLWRRDPVLELQFLTFLHVVLIVLCSSVSADRSVMAASRLLGAAAACVFLVISLACLLSRVHNRNVLRPFNGALACCDIPGVVTRSFLRGSLH